MLTALLAFSIRGWAQSPAMVSLDITVTTPGTLGDLIWEQGVDLDHVEKLIVRGPLDDVDLKTIRDMAALQVLSMTDAEVEDIPDGWFRDKLKIKQIQLPKTLKTLGNEVFYGDTCLTYVTMPDRMTKWGSQMFVGCKHLSSCAVPQGIEELPSSTFAGCENLRGISLPEGLLDIGRNAFSWCHALGAIMLPSTTRRIDPQALYFCNSLRSVSCYAVTPPVFDSSSPDYSYMGDGEHVVTVYVPVFSENAYRQAVGWCRYPIATLSGLPTSLIFHSDLELNLPVTLPADYKPKMELAQHFDYQLSPYNFGYPAVSINGTETLSLSDFHAIHNTYPKGYSTYDDYVNTDKLYGSLICNAPVRSDKVSVTYMTNKPVSRWLFFSLPFNALMKDIEFAKGSDFVIYEFLGEKRAAKEFDDTWHRIPAVGGSLTAGRGYIMKCSNTDEEVTFHAINDNYKNNIFRRTEANVYLEEYLAEDAHNRSWNLVGNPYPAYYDSRLMQIDAPFVVWDALNSHYATYTPYDDDYVFVPGEAFFVQRPVDQASIVFPLEGRQTSRAVIDRTPAPSRRAGVSSARSVFNLTLTTMTAVGGSPADNQTDRTRFVLNPQATTAYDYGRDATKFMSLDAQVPQLYTLEGSTRYSINERPVGDGVISLGMSLGTAGTYSLSLSAVQHGSTLLDDLWLVDHETGERVLLTDGGYTFTADAGTLDDRFTIEVGEVVTAVDDVAAETQQTVQPVYDLQGRRHDGTLTKGLYIIGGRKHVIK